ncbi:DNA oxidative demethylase ALKBH2 [Araneus ventricosus]|uniref:DNA oxidative demethylase ALKBH2 n=1 Tax=Araneus ventricosus TaxID=182803 RepID=A0A4Y2LG04_ARAVE|nr:DNA oxidative demethylase ALKBH2 [Araneus ventricosus]
MLIDTPYLSLGYVKYFSKDAADSILEQLEKHVTYLPSEACRVWGKYSIPRSMASYGDEGLIYRFSGGTFKTKPWIPILQQLAQVANEFLPKHERFNYVLINRYKNGNDYIGFHQDNEPDICTQTPIVAFSFGAQRDLVFKRIQYTVPREECKNHPITLKVPLEHGSILIMYPPTNEYYTHGLPKRLRCKDARISLTFRKIQNKDG